MNPSIETIEENNEQELNINSKVIKNNTGNTNTGNNLIFSHKYVNVNVIKQTPQIITTSDDEEEIKDEIKEEIFYKHPWYKNISVEPVLFLYMFAFMITSVVEQDLFLQKACHVNKNYSNEICSNIKNSSNVKYKKEVQKIVAQFLQWESILANIFPIILSLFIGSFSDKYGRKIPLLIGLSGKIFYSFMIIINSQMALWPLEYILLTATLPCALTGSDIAIFSSCFAYISDITSIKNRTIRVTILDGCYLFAMPLGVILGAYLFNNCLNHSYANMFILNLTVLSITFIYSILVLKCKTTAEQHSIKELIKKGVFSEFFNKKHIKESIKLITNKDNINKDFIILILITAVLFTFQREEGKYLYVYSVFKFKWDINTYSIFKTIKSFSYFIGVMVCIPVMNKIFKWRETVIIFVGISAHIITRIFYYNAYNSNIFYIGGIVCGLGPVVSPMIRSILSKLVSNLDRGKAFSLLSVCDNAAPFLSSVFYSQIYRFTIDNEGKGGKGIFVLTIITQMIVFLLIFFVHILLKNKNEIKNRISDEDKISIQMDSFVSIPLNINEDNSN